MTNSTSRDNRPPTDEEDTTDDKEPGSFPWRTLSIIFVVILIAVGFGWHLLSKKSASTYRTLPQITMVKIVPLPTATPTPPQSLATPPPIAPDKAPDKLVDQPDPKPAPPEANHEKAPSLPPALGTSITGPGNSYGLVGGGDDGIIGGGGEGGGDGKSWYADQVRKAILDRLSQEKDSHLKFQLVNNPVTIRIRLSPEGTITKVDILAGDPGDMINMPEKLKGLQLPGSPPDGMTWEKLRVSAQ
jgi:hypothetical protein